MPAVVHMLSREIMVNLSSTGNNDHEKKLSVSI